MEKAREEIRRQWKKMEEKDEEIEKLRAQVTTAAHDATSELRADLDSLKLKLREAEAHIVMLESQLQEKDESHLARIVELKEENKKHIQDVRLRYAKVTQEQRDAFMALKASRTAILERLKFLHARGLKLQDAFNRERALRKSLVAKQGNGNEHAKEDVHEPYPKKLALSLSAKMTVHISSTHSPAVVGDMVEATLLEDLGGRQKFQWFRSSHACFVPIHGATSESYRCTADDFGATLKVECSVEHTDGIRDTTAMTSLPIQVTDDQIEEIRRRVRNNEAQYNVHVINEDGSDNKRRLLLNLEKVKIRAKKNTLVKASYHDALEIKYCKDHHGFGNTFTIKFGPEATDVYHLAVETSELRDHILMMTRVFKALHLRGPKKLKPKQRVSLIQPHFLIFLAGPSAVNGSTDDISALDEKPASEHQTDGNAQVDSAAKDVQYDSDGFCIRDGSDHENGDEEIAAPVKPMVILPPKLAKVASIEEIQAAAQDVAAPPKSSNAPRSKCQVNSSKPSA